MNFLHMNTVQQICNSQFIQISLIHLSTISGTLNVYKKIHCVSNTKMNDVGSLLPSSLLSNSRPKGSNASNVITNGVDKAFHV